LLGQKVLVLQLQPEFRRLGESRADLGGRFAGDLFLASHDFGYELGRTVDHGGEVGLRPSPKLEFFAEKFADRCLIDW